MPLSLSDIAKAEKNKLDSSSVWLLMLEIQVPNTSPIYIVKNNENITWRSQTWVAFPFSLDEIGEESKGTVPKVQLRVSNVSRAMELYLQQYDLYCKTNGYSPITVSIYIVNSLNLASSDPEVQYDFELIQPKTDAYWATFTLGAMNPFDRRFPVGRMTKNHCRHRFNYPPGTDYRCGYSGVETTCGKTLSDCRDRDNEGRFGGCPGLGTGGIRLA